MALKYSTEVTVNLPRQRVVELMEDPNNMKHWQPGFISMEPISGTQGEEGAKALLKYDMGKRKIEMTETIVKQSLPEELVTTYDADAIHNIQTNKFIELDANRTKWVSESEFEFGSFGMKLMGMVMPGAFKKQSQKYLDMFKEFAEKQG